MIQPPAKTVFAWLKSNLGPRCVAPLTSTDAKALQAAVQIVELYAFEPGPEIAKAFGIVVACMQPHTWPLAYHAIAHVMDWDHRREIWDRSGLPTVNTAAPKPSFILEQPRREIPIGRCAYEPGGGAWLGGVK